MFFPHWPLASCFPELDEFNTDRSVVITSYTFPILYCSVASQWLALTHVMFFDNVSTDSVQFLSTYTDESS